MGHATPWAHWGNPLRRRSVSDFSILCLGLSSLTSGWLLDFIPMGGDKVTNLRYWLQCPVASCTKCWATVRASPQPQSTYCNADCTSPREPGHHSPASVVVPPSARVCQLPGYHIDQPHSWHAGGGWVPSPIFCKIQPRSTDDSVFWVFLRRLVLLSVTHIMIESGEVCGRHLVAPAGSWVLLSSPACLQVVFSGVLSVLAPSYTALPGHLWNVGSGPINCSVR